MGDEPSAGPCLTSPWRALDEKITRVEPQGAGFHFAEIVRVDPLIRRQPSDSRSLPFEHGFQRRIPSIPFLNRLGESQESHSLLRIVIGAAGNERLRKRRAGEAGTAQQFEGS